MQVTDQIDFAKPEHVSVICKGTQLTVHVKGTTSSVKLIYQLEGECTYGDPVPNEVTYKGPNFCTPPLPPLQQSLPRSWVVENLGGIKS
jgi:hypothetical protein